jgi:hypothetical protein
MKFVLQILFLLLTWLTTFANATPPAQKLTIPNYSISFSTTETQKISSAVKIGIQNFARSGIAAKSGSHFLNSTSQKGVLQGRNVSENRVWQKRQWSWRDENKRVF